MIRNPRKRPDLSEQIGAAAYRAITDYQQQKRISRLHPAASDVYVQPLSELRFSTAERARIGIAEGAYSGSFVEVLLEVEEGGEEWRVELALLAPAACYQAVEDVGDAPAETAYLCRQKLTTVYGDASGWLACYGHSSRIQPFAGMVYALCVMGMRGG